MSEDVHDSNNYYRPEQKINGVRWHGPLPPKSYHLCASLGCEGTGRYNRHGEWFCAKCVGTVGLLAENDPTADFTAAELVELAQLRRSHGVGDTVEEIREALGHGRLTRDSNFEFDNHALDDMARRFYKVEEDNRHEAVAVVYGFAIESPSLQDVIRAHGQGLGTSPDLLPTVRKEVYDACRRELDAYDAQRRRVK